ncbi:MAG: hypothetical protein HC810_08315 [Acaryochloridaceae cyanobacterium RL_2_7]|nr:hypothetical protein [Acaryochloridaceae cyanobacterium RL_2_7]
MTVMQILDQTSTTQYDSMQQASAESGAREDLDLSPLLGNRLCLILDNQVSSEVAVEMEKVFLELPFFLNDIDRADTAHVRHLVHHFDSEELSANKVIQFIAERTQLALTNKGIQVGDLRRAYVNLNLFGDHQFAHYDGPEWTALLFICGEWQSDWGGEFLVYPQDGQQGIAAAN